MAATRAEIAATGSFTAERVAARAGASPATFYSYFPSKAEALTAAFASVMAELVAFCERELAIERLLDAGLDAWCEAVVAAAADFFAEHERIFRAALAALPGSRPLRAVYRDSEAAAFAVHRRFVERGQRAGQLRAGDAEAIARGLLVLLQGLNNPVVLHDGAGAVRGELARALRSHLAPAPGA